MAQPKLLIFTGKGGVGKTTLACEHALKYQTPLYALNDDALYSEYKINHHVIDLKEATHEYMARKIHSETIATWIQETKIFQSVFQMTPALGNLINLGKVLDVLRTKQEEKIIFDAPSSGHFKALLDSFKNFPRIFKSGILFSDALDLESVLCEESTQINIVAIPTHLALEESLELQESIKELYPKIKTNIILNQYLVPTITQNEFENLPEFLKRKIEVEEKIYEKYKKNISSICAYKLI